MNTLLKTLMTKKIIGFLIIGLFTGQAWALDLDSAKSAGLIGEQANGYLGIVSKPATDETVALVKDINSKRKAKYMEIANDQGVELNVVEKRAGAKVIEKTESGHYINTGDTWQKK